MADKAEEMKCSSELQYFREDSGVTDVILTVEDKEIHVTKVILMRSSPVFRAMFTDDFKEKSESRVTFPGKSYEDFVLFLRSFYPGELLELNVSVIERILPLAREYGMDALMKSFHERLLVDAESQTKDVFFHLKCFYIAAVYNFDELYNRMLENLRSVAVNTYKNRESFKMLLPEDKAQLYEKRCEFVEKHNSNLLNKMSRIKENLDSFEIWCEKCGKCMYISRKDKIWIWG